MSILRIGFFLAATAAVILGEVWLANNPGAVTIFWRGHRVDTSVAVILHIVFFLVVAAALAYRFWGALVRVPQQIRLRARLRRERRGYDALSEGLIAAAAGDATGALRLAKKAAALLDSPPIAKLLTAQAAELTGDTAAARENFQALARNPQTALLGIRGLMGEARRRGDTAEALRLANEAYRLRPEAEGLLAQRLELQIESDCWAGAEATVREAVRRKEMSAEEGAERRAVLLYEQARLAERAGDAAGAQSLLQDAVKLNPYFIAGTAKLAELFGLDGKARRGARLIEKIWAENPHPSLTVAYRALESELKPLEQVKRFETLAAANPDHGESHIALAEASLAAELWGEARAQLQRVIETDGLTPRLCRLMATLEGAEYQDQDKARHWLAQTASASPDAAWLCTNCGAEAPAWQGRCGLCGGFNTLAWQAPPRIARLAESETAELLGVPS